MTYSVHQHWDPLKVCAVGRSYPPEFYSFVKNTKARSVLERIAEETEEDYQKLINLLESFGVQIVRSDIPANGDMVDGQYVPPPMCPRDYTAMIGDKFFMPGGIIDKWDRLKGQDWPNCPNSAAEFQSLSPSVLIELQEKYNINTINDLKHIRSKTLQSVQELVLAQSNSITYNLNEINTAMVTRIGKDLYFGTETLVEDVGYLQKKYTKMFPEYRCHIIETGGHADGLYCPVVPGLIVSLYDVSTYAETFPGWEVVYLPGQSWDAVRPFLDLKEKNRGKWWVPGEESNNEFTDYVESWLGHWMGYVEETVFDVNMLVIDEKNVVCNNYNEDVFNAFDRYGITPHIVNFRHRYFWDGGLHCITSDLHREGTRKDYFPKRG